MVVMVRRRTVSGERIRESSMLIVRTDKASAHIRSTTDPLHPGSRRSAPTRQALISDQVSYTGARRMSMRETVRVAERDRRPMRHSAGRVRTLAYMSVLSSDITSPRRRERPAAHAVMTLS